MSDFVHVESDEEFLEESYVVSRGNMGKSPATENRERRSLSNSNNLDKFDLEHSRLVESEQMHLNLEAEALEIALKRIRETELRSKELSERLENESIQKELATRLAREKELEYKAMVERSEEISRKLEEEVQNRLKIELEIKQRELAISSLSVQQTDLEVKLSRDREEIEKMAQTNQVMLSKLKEAEDKRQALENKLKEEERTRLELAETKKRADMELAYKDRAIATLETTRKIQDYDRDSSFALSMDKDVKSIVSLENALANALGELEALRLHHEEVRHQHLMELSAAEAEKQAAEEKLREVLSQQRRKEEEEMSLKALSELEAASGSITSIESLRKAILGESAAAGTSLSSPSKEASDKREKEREAERERERARDASTISALNNRIRKLEDDLVFARKEAQELREEMAPLREALKELDPRYR